MFFEAVSRPDEAIPAQARRLLREKRSQHLHLAQVQV